MKPIQKIIKLLKTHNSFALFTHISPDGDAIGSCNALRLALTRLGKTVYIYCDGEAPKNFKFIESNFETDPSHISEVEVCLMVDCNALDRTGKYQDYLKDAPILACIDHHQRNKQKFTCKYIDSTSPSACDLVYKVIKSLKVKVDKEIARYLYIGSSTDTGGYRHTNTTAQCHKIAGELLKTGFDLQETNFYLFKYKTLKQIQFFKYVFKTFKTYLDGELLVVFVNNSVYRKFKDIIELGGVFDFLTGIDGNEIVAKIVEREKGAYTVGLRSNQYANVCNVVQTLGGGGHKMAAGCRVTDKSYKELLEILIEQCKSELKNGRDN